MASNYQLRKALYKQIKSKDLTVNIAANQFFKLVKLDGDTFLLNIDIQTDKGNITIKGLTKNNFNSYNTTSDIELSVDAGNVVYIKNTSTDTTKITSTSIELVKGILNESYFDMTTTAAGAVPVFNSKTDKGTFDAVTGSSSRIKNTVSSFSDRLYVGGPSVLNSTLAVNGLATLHSLSITNNTTIGGTLGVNGATTLSNTLDVAGDLSVTDKFNVDAETGNTDIDGYLGVAGDLSVTDKFKVDASTGNTDIAGDLGVTGNSSSDTFTSTTTTSAPFTILSTILVDNLNADYLDGQHGSYYAADSTVVKLTGNQTIAGIKTFSSTISGSISGNAGTVTNGVYTTGAQSIAGVKTFTDIPVFNGGTTGSTAPFTVDSAFLVTNLNADLLDGQQGSYYLDYNNFTNKPTIGNGTLTLSTSGIASGSATFTANQTTGSTFTVNVPATDLTLGTITATGVPILSSTGADISTLPAATGTLAGILTASTQTIGGNKTFANNVIISGDLTVNGTNTILNTTTVSTEDDIIVLRSAGTEGVPMASHAGLVSKYYDGTNSGALVFDNTGTAYVGDVTLNGDGTITDVSMQPLLTRDTNANLANNDILVWNTSRAVGKTLAELNIQPLDADLTAIAALSGTAGLLRKTAANTWGLDNTVYENSANRVTTIRPSSTATDSNYPSEKAVAIRLDNIDDLLNDISGEGGDLGSLNNRITNLEDGKQDKLIAGDNINIVGNTISVDYDDSKTTDYFYTSDILLLDGLNLANNVDLQNVVDTLHPEEIITISNIKIGHGMRLRINRPNGGYTEYGVATIIGFNEDETAIEIIVKKFSGSLLNSQSQFLVIGTIIKHPDYPSNVYVNTTAGNFSLSNFESALAANVIRPLLTNLVEADIPSLAISKITNLQTTLDGKEPAITAGTTAQYWRGDKTWQTLPIAPPTNLGTTYNATSVTITSSTGNNATIDGATDEAAGVLTTGEQTIAGTKTFNNNVSVKGDLTVEGDINVNNVNVIETSNGIIFEGTPTDDYVTTLKAKDPTSNRIIELPNASGTVALIENLPEGKSIKIEGSSLVWDSASESLKFVFT